MTKQRTVVFIIAVMLQIALLIGMALRQRIFIATGEKVILACVPVDPRSLFSGDYVNLNYEISALSEKIPGFDSLPSDGKTFTVYVALAKDPASALWHATEVSQDIAALEKKYSKIIRGKCDPSGNYHITYGIEHYFVPQNEGRVIEQNILRTTAEVALDSDGSSGLSRLFIDGIEVSFQ